MLHVVIKADVQGSAEALADALSVLSTEHASVSGLRGLQVPPFGLRSRRGFPRIRWLNKSYISRTRSRSEQRGTCRGNKVHRTYNFAHSARTT